MQDNPWRLIPLTSSLSAPSVQLGEKFRKELESICTQTVQPERVLVYIAEGYPRPEFTVGKEEYVWVSKGMISQRVFKYDDVSSDCIMILDDDVQLQRVFGYRIDIPILKGSYT